MSPVRVMQSFLKPIPTSNPFLSLFLSCLPDDVEASTFSWRAALRGNYDVFHLHWPERLCRGTDPVRTATKQGLALVLLARLRMRRIAIVRTVHNATPHEQGHPIERLILRWWNRSTDYWVSLSNGDNSSSTIPHGHYRDWFDRIPIPDPAPGRLLYFGLIRPYKNVPGLVSAFRQLSGADLRLRVVGKPHSIADHDQVVAAASGDDRISTILSYVDDTRLAREIGKAELIVLPYHDMHNSGAVLLALSLGRPVLVPDRPTNLELAAEVGDEWVLTYSGALGADVLARAIAQVRRPRRTTGPDLHRRDWPRVGRQYAQAYRAAMARRKRSAPHDPSADIDDTDNI